MRKILMLLVVGCLGISTGQASSLFLQDGKSTPIRKGENGPCSHGRPRAPRHSPTFQIWYEPGVNAVLVVSSADVGPVQAIIENLTSGTLYTYSFDSSSPAILPISGEPGVWKVILRSTRGITITYEFIADIG